MAHRCCRAVAFALLLGLSFSLLPASSALAHAVLVRSEPASNALLIASPPEVHLWLSEPLVPGLSAIAVLDSRGDVVHQGETRLAAANSTEMAVSLPPLPNGTYRVNWRAFSAVDGHTTEGVFAFSVGVAEGQGASAVSSAPPLSGSAVFWRWLLYFSHAVIVGAVTFRLLVWAPAIRGLGWQDDAGSLPHATSRSGVFLAALALAALSATGLFLHQVRGAAEASLGDLLSGRVPWGAIFAGRIGTVWIGRIATLIALGLTPTPALRATPPPLPRSGRGEGGEGLWNYAALFLCAQLLFITALSSHSAALAGAVWYSLPVLADWAHLAAIAVWAGGLLMFAFVVPRTLRNVADDERAALLRGLFLRFSTVAAFAVGTMLVAGVYLASLHVGGWENLFDSEYGHALTWKAALAAVMLLFGAANLLWVRPALESNARCGMQGAGVHPRSSVFISVPSLRLFALEASIGVLVLAASGLLTELPRGADAASIGAGQLKLATRADDLRVTLSLSPARRGPNGFEVAVSSAGRLISEATVSLRFTAIDRPLGSTEVLLEAADAGLYRVNDASLSVAGGWLVEAIVRREGRYDVFAPFRVFVRTDGRIAAGRSGSSEIARVFLPFAAWFTGLGLIAFALIWIPLAGRAAGGRAAGYALLFPSVIAAFFGARFLWQALSQATPASRLANPVASDAASLANGQAIYDGECAECHGTEGRGDGPRAAELSRPPKDFRASRAAEAADGDLFWWIQNGVAGSEMPAFRAILADDEIWDVVNYLRALGVTRSAVSRVEGVPTSIAGPTPTPPGGPLPAPGPSDDRAITLLDQAEAAMAALNYLREDQVIRDDAGNEVTFTALYAAPDRMSLVSSEGQEIIAIGVTQYYRAGGGEWQTFDLPEPYAFPPTHGYTQDAVGAQYDGAGALDGRPAEIVSFADATAPAAYRLWLDAETKRILQLAMEAPDHHMISRYSSFDEAVEIESPLGD